MVTIIFESHSTEKKLHLPLGNGNLVGLMS